MDHTDFQILNLLQADSRTNYKEIGSHVGLTAPAVSRRICIMKDQGIIRKFSVSFNRKKLSYETVGFLRIAVKPAEYSKFCVFCDKEQKIISHFHLVGKYNALIRFAVHNSQESEQLLADVEKYGQREMFLELETYFENKEFFHET